MRKRYMRFVRKMDLPQRNPNNPRKNNSMTKAGRGQEGNLYSRFLSNQMKETISITEMDR